MSSEKKVPATVAAAEKSYSGDYFAYFNFENFDFNLETFLKAGVHFGHHKSRQNPKMGKYIFTYKREIGIIDLEKTAEKLEEAMAFLREVKKSGKQVLLATTKKQFKDLVRSLGLRCQWPYVNSRWLGGTFTNFKVIRERARYLRERQAAMERGEFDKYTKFERSKIEEELKKLEEKMGGIKEMKELPGAVIVTDVKSEMLAVKEAKKMGIPVIAITDTNNDPEIVDYPIPANDDAVTSIKVIFSAIGKAWLMEEQPILFKKNQK